MSSTTNRNSAIAQAIAKIHSRHTGAPIGFAQCIFQNTNPSDHFIGGVPAPAGSVWVLGHIRAGRSAEVKNGILTGITKLLVDVLGVPDTMVWTYLNELDHHHMVEFGRVLPADGEEWNWVSRLPHGLRDRITVQQGDDSTG
ncbi:tautomerase family protein [Mycobacterium antarcticum]|uniref:tautomerase family protein n=1 Tax=Mycolicibacterium sp. TUM20985 TaxID=3023370 RepID=UPI002572DE33|nr:tautomerase family protein [Mycolicibacterium sp. TUM20985]